MTPDPLARFTSVLDDLGLPRLHMNGVELELFQNHMVTGKARLLPEKEMPSHGSWDISQWLLVSPKPRPAFKF